jgi:hypothetical protein
VSGTPGRASWNFHAGVGRGKTIFDRRKVGRASVVCEVTLIEIIPFDYRCQLLTWTEPTISETNHVRCSVSSIQFSIRLAVATSLCFSHTRGGTQVSRQLLIVSAKLGDVVGHREDLSTVLIEQEVVIAEERAAHVPVEVLRLNVKCKHVGEQFTKLARDLLRPRRH